ncbi:MAG: histidinol-phosphatase [Caenispirillum bisanense]|nr:histidinol-phosphatase [Caenispirillum bisanense]MCA1972554.1 histidinol-phosphatase [Caenispirillum sp.]
MTVSSLSSPAVPAELLALANRLADTSGAVIRQYFRTPVAVDDKSDASPVTIADRGAEEAIRAVLAEVVPDHGIIGEEFGRANEGAELVWVLDPIDGTKAFISGKPSFGTLIALLKDGRPWLGVIDQPITGERWIGAAGHGTTLAGKALKTRPCTDLAQATLYATAPEMFKGDDWTAFQRLYQSVKLPRYGSDCYAYGLLALGFVDLVCEADLKVYDWAAVVPVIEQAGGIVTDWQGRPLTPDSDGHVLAAGDARLHAAALERLAG